MDVENHIKSNQTLKLHKKALINLLITSQYVSDRINAILKTFDLTTPQFNVLRILKGQKGRPANLSTIQDRMISKMSNTTRIVDKLIEKELVSRQTCKDNRRKIEIFITENGHQLLDQVNPHFEKEELLITSQLSEKELIELNNHLNKIRTNE
ncbi:MarR family winged helix-turn-helix transcriptional regulator [Psychroflexus sp. ALD_RP9]|uniref:MarR family winged helix-turn-helix transcriptional regulator n=1 Tax=Psychroflexus sp. ALD_RP9 TaxID=2777186 RepID=UPI001A8C4A48|nr:MarR family transcriptional regulator [Psychroflexus sp. ALD_RP9]QSS97145.1 MarR family transcriptional regulator [Psychroflexus sp. ALD_RP9]